jgi:MFS superfamily sulfate permease-like transporter
VIVFAASFGVGQGLSFIARAILPARLFGTDGYGAITGKLATVRLFAMAGAPMCTALAIAHTGVAATLGLLSLVAVMTVVASWGLLRIESKAAAGHSVVPTAA